MTWKVLHFNTGNAVRELLHGMGFQSQLYPTEIPWINSMVAVPGLENSVDKDRHISMFTLSAFDNLLSGSFSFAKQGIILGRGAPGKPGLTIKHLSYILKQSPSLASAMIELYRMISSDSIRIKFSDGESVLMHHFRYNVEYTPIRYFGNVLASGPDFLMSPFFRPGTSLISEMKKLKVDSPIGPYTIRVMEALGYATKANPQILELELVI